MKANALNLEEESFLMALASFRIMKMKDDTYEEYYRYGFRHGKGFMKFSPHSIYDSYDGEWWKDLEHGFGKRVKRDSSFYEGEFEDGAQHGVGKYTYADGKVEAGVYMEGFFVCP